LNKFEVTRITINTLPIALRSTRALRATKTVATVKRGRPHLLLTPYTMELFMIRRHLLFMTLAASLLWLASSAHALTIKPFSTTEWTNAQNAGAAVAIHFSAGWCPTCRVQSAAFQRLKTDPSLDAVTLLVADYDQEKELMKQMNVRSQSTLVVFKGKAEVIRDSGATDVAKLQALLARGL
jgi:thioredoxin 1